MEDKRVKYYSNSDLNISIFLERVEYLLNNTNFNEGLSINDLLEIYNVTKFIDNEIYFHKWNTDYIENALKKNKFFKKNINRLFQHSKLFCIKEKIEVLDEKYKNDFLELFEKNKSYNIYSELEFEEIFMHTNLRLQNVLRYKNIVKKYEGFIKEVFLESESNIELIFKSLTKNASTKFYFPSNISKREYLKQFDRYIYSPYVNLNYLNIVIINPKELCDFLNINALKKVEIKRIIDMKEKELFRNHMKFSQVICITKDEYIKQVKLADNYTIVDLIDSAWIKKHRDYSTLFSNIQNLYGFFTEDIISTLPSFPRLESNVILESIGVKTSRYYSDGFIFNFKTINLLNKLRVLKKILFKYNISFENMMNWFFNEYLKYNFDVQFLYINIPNNIMEEKYIISILCNIEENIKKQYFSINEYNYIDKKIYNEIGSISIEQLMSKVEKKYIYLVDNTEINNIIYLLFSDQSVLTYISDDINSSNFDELIRKYELKISSFQDYQQPYIKELIEKEILNVDNSTNYIFYKDEAFRRIMLDLWEREVISYHHRSVNEKAILDNLLNDGLVEIENTLFSRPESAFLNYILNNSKFDNSIGLRNKYQHGFPSYEDDTQYINDYYLIISILFIYIIKIHDDLNCLMVQKGQTKYICDIDLEY